MRRQTGRVAAAVLFTALASPSFGQIAGSQISASPANQSAKAVRPIPAYTAEFKTTNVRTLANGTTITTETKEVRARDSQGRALSIRTRTPPGAGIEVTSGNVENPVDNTKIIWNSHDKKASVLRLPVQDQRHGCWTSDSRHLTIHYDGDAPPSNTIVGDGGGAGSAMVGAEFEVTPKTEQMREDLGTASIQGLEAKGTRFTSVIPAGKVGNDNPITTTREIWRAPGFPLPLREISEDPRTGKMTRETVSLTIGEPDIALFQPPEGYEVVNEEMHEVPCQQ